MTDNATVGHFAEWPTTLLDPADARRWIAAVLPGHPVVAGPTTIHRRKGWGVTARFAVRPAAGPDTADVIFKASTLPLFAHAPRTYALLTRHCPTVSPDLIARTRRDDTTWMLFRPFAGPTVRAACSLGRTSEDADGAPRSSAPLVALARTFAEVQATIAALPRAAMAGIPRVAVDQLPAQFDDLLRLISDRHLAAWRADGGAIQREMGLPSDPLAQLNRWRVEVAGWAAELVAGAWPETIDHVDLHADNAIVQADGTPLIYDWEEATIGCPFYSLDRLLAEARWFDRGGDPAVQAADDAGGGPAERAVRDAYLAALPWRDRVARERALDLALALAPIKLANEGEAFAAVLGWDQGHPRYTAWLLARALRRWAALRT